MTTNSLAQMQTMTPDLASDVGYYVYAIARPRDETCAHPLPAEGIIPGAPIEALSYKDTLAIFSPVPLSEFNQTALEQNLQEANWVRNRVIAHQAVLTSLLGAYTIVPLQFCTVYLSTERVLNALADGYAGFDQILKQLCGATEWGVKVYCDLPVYARQLEESSGALKTQRDAMKRARPGTAFLLRKKLEQAAQAIAERAATDTVQDIHAQLAAQASHSRLNQAQTASEHGHSDEMFLNGAYLVDDANWPSFRATLDALVASLREQGFQIELTGPWPPYNFVASRADEATDG
ncbi:MAG: GvpL/GvpF family gas vesicle protein [Chloroflexi bacterium]|nr:GvpL/GvpF family gas vesicle protein [Chloroflexota bacterium]